MCFYIHKQHQEVKIAEKDITCYKVLAKYGKHKYESLHKRHMYLMGEIETVENFTFDTGNYNNLKNSPERIPYSSESSYAKAITVGLHSFSDIGRATFELVEGMRDPSNRRRKNSKLRLCVFKIPKGALYYYNPVDDEYVSNEIIFKGQHPTPHILSVLIGKLTKMPKKII